MGAKCKMSSGDIYLQSSTAEISCFFSGPGSVNDLTNSIIAYVIILCAQLTLCILTSVTGIVSGQYRCNGSHSTHSPPPHTILCYPIPTSHPAPTNLWKPIMKTHSYPSYCSWESFTNASLTALFHMAASLWSRDESRDIVSLITAPPCVGCQCAAHCSAPECPEPSSLGKRWNIPPILRANGLLCFNSLDAESRQEAVISFSPSSRWIRQRK